MDNKIGLYRKYTVINNHNGEEVENAFVLRPLSDPIALEVLKLYASSLEECNLKSDLEKWINDIEVNRCVYNKRCDDVKECRCCKFCSRLSECGKACDIVVYEDYSDCEKFEVLL